jgi:hypothetical protein
VSNIILDSGQILIITAQNLSYNDIKRINEVVKNDDVIHIEKSLDYTLDEYYQQIKSELFNNKVILS